MNEINSTNTDSLIADLGHLEHYFITVLAKEGSKGKHHVESMRATCDQFLNLRIRNFDNAHSSKLLLLGEVQSGKTSQMLALIAAMADENELFRTFILLTSRIVALQQQTLFRCLESLPTMEVCGENDEIRLMANRNRRPALIILKKDPRVLRRWRDILLSSDLLKGRPIVVFDDEADATSLNTKVNSGEQSTINRHLEEIVATASSSVFVQVTATPQALFLQTEDSGWRPQDSIYFPPGNGYLGGSFFFSNPPPYSYRRTNSGELAVLCRRGRGFPELPKGFKEAVANYLIASSHVLKKSGGTTTFLIHPSWTQDVHSRIEERLSDALSLFATEFDSPEVQGLLKQEWIDLQCSFPELLPLERLESIIRENAHQVHVLNSAPQNVAIIDFEEGSNIIVGGNSLGRGLTFPMLLTVYYCRESRIPQQDTIWQHCRMFGYDRIAGLSRMFMPGDLFDLFSETHAANEAFVELVKDGDSSGVQILTGNRARPTRRAVVDQSLFAQYVGGVNYFPNIPDQDLWCNLQIDEVIAKKCPTDGDIEISLEELIELLSLFESANSGEWLTSGFVSALKLYQGHRDAKKSGRLMVRRDRDIGFGTGTLLSPNDRTITMSIRDRPLLVLYRVVGSREKGWNGKSFWIPNVKLPTGFVFNFVN